MPASYATTPLHMSIRSVAERALATTDGVELEFLAAQYGSLDAARHACRRAGQAFSSLRTKERRKAQHIRGNGDGGTSRDTLTWGRYDRLSCLTHALPDGRGVVLQLVPAHMFEELVTVRDIATGERLNVFGDAGSGRHIVLVQRLFHAVDNKQPCPWTTDECIWLQSAHPGIWRDLEGRYGTDYLLNHETVMDPADDVADMDLDEWAKGEEG